MYYFCNLCFFLKNVVIKVEIRETKFKKGLTPQNSGICFFGMRFENLHGFIRMMNTYPSNLTEY